MRFRKKDHVMTAQEALGFIEKLDVIPESCQVDYLESLSGYVVWCPWQIVSQDREGSWIPETRPDLVVICRTGGTIVKAVFGPGVLTVNPGRRMIISSWSKEYTEEVMNELGIPGTTEYSYRLSVLGS